LFRSFIQSNQGSLAARRMDEIISQGQLMPVFFPVYSWAHELIQNYTGAEDIIMDGVARRAEEAKILDSALDFFQVQNRLVLHIDIFDETAVQRLLIRNQGRTDDATPEKIQKRLDWYRENVLPVFEYFHNHENYRFASINGEETPEGVFDQIKSLIA
jgi:adenylate kinase